MSATRLDRVVTLLGSGHTALIRNTAAGQLADVQKLHPDELFNLLTRIAPLLRSKNWDTRAAAAKAIGGIVENAKRFDPNEDESDNGNVLPTPSSPSASRSEKGEASCEHLPVNPAQLDLHSLPVDDIVQNGKPLLASASKEWDYQFLGMDTVQRLAFLRDSLRARLGFFGRYVDQNTELLSGFVSRGSKQLDRAIRLDTNMDSFVSNTTLYTPISAEALESELSTGLTPRQLNLLKRKKKKEVKNQLNKVRVVDFTDKRITSPGVASPAPMPLRTDTKREEDNVSTDYFSTSRPDDDQDDDSKVVTEFKGAPVAEKSVFEPDQVANGDEWPFQCFSDYLALDLFDPEWEIRHGAAVGLRELIRVHGRGAGRMRGKSLSENNSLNNRWLNDLASRICALFMLDRFGDYISDQVVVPVRESSGQTLAAILKHMNSTTVTHTFTVLYKLIIKDKPSKSFNLWQPRHGGMIGMKYLVATRSDLLSSVPDLLDGVLHCVMASLADDDDDIRAVAAATLIPVVKEIVDSRPHVLDRLISTVWACLSDLGDDLSASTGNVMDLLAKLCSFSQVLDVMRENASRDDTLSFTKLVPRLFPFLRHTISSVRQAVLRALLTFIQISDENSLGWVDEKALRLVFQNILLERTSLVLDLSRQTWDALVDILTSANSQIFAGIFFKITKPLFVLTMHPIGPPRHKIPTDHTLFIRPSGQSFPPSIGFVKGSPTIGDGAKKRGRKKEDRPVPAALQVSHNIDGPAMDGDVDLVTLEVMLRNKIAAARALAKAMHAWPSNTRHDAFSKLLLPYFASSHGTTQLFASFTLEEYAKLAQSQDDLMTALMPSLKAAVETERPPCYTDLTVYLLIVRNHCQGLLSVFREVAHVNPSRLPQMAAVVQGEENASLQYAFSIADAEKIIGLEFDKLTRSLSAAQKIAVSKPADDARGLASDAINISKQHKEDLDVRIMSAAAGAIAACLEIPKKPALTIKAIMGSIKTEENFDLQKRSAAAIATVIHNMDAHGKKIVVDKIVNNLVKFYCTETAETPEFHVNASMIDGILSLKKDEDIRDHADAVGFEREAKKARIMRRGSKEALDQIVLAFGDQLFSRLTVLNEIIERPLVQAFGEKGLPDDILQPSNNFGQQIVDGLSALKALVPRFHSALHPTVEQFMPLITRALQVNLAVLRYAAAKCFATICSVLPVSGITTLVEKVIPKMNSPLDLHARQGAVECIYHLIHAMEDRILPYVIFLIVPILGRMSDSNGNIRQIAATTFATLVKLVPLEAGIADPPGFSTDMLRGRERERNFIAQMLDPKKAEDFQIPVGIKAELRPYQQDGVNWLAFLNRFNLHGILCDDMGLGKTLQTLCMVASDHHIRAQEFEKSQDPDLRCLPSLIICPPTLAGHWQQEIKQFAPFLRSVLYTGPSSERQRNRHLLSEVDIVITSYEVCRNDVSILSPVSWNYCVLDEGHLIKNPKAKTSQAVKTLNSCHRLILSGTPIQNNVFELWSLFDFLMPGFLGSEKVFQDRFAKPIAASRNAKSSSKEQETGALAIETLHKQVLPFLLRRLKEEVLNDLPPKILQNYYCDLSDLQIELFQEFGNKQKALNPITTTSSLQRSNETQEHIFKALQYMRKLCNAPSLVVKEGTPQHERVTAKLAAKNSSLLDISHAPKLTALRDLLVDCGIGTNDLEGAVSQHRALIFCQMKEMLDMVQEHVFRKLLPSAQFLRLDGSVEANKRQDIVNKFNSDPSYDCLLLTTSVGGLGLNLTGADTVIFVEHDWNPQKDMQAMDRAHRIGQKKVVNVYRIVTRGTLEEKILSLQRFKIDVASTVVNQQNAALGNMETDQLLDLFNVSATATGAGDAVPVHYSQDTMLHGATVTEESTVDSMVEPRGSKGMQDLLDGMAAMWDEKQYDEEYNLDSFLASLK